MILKDENHWRERSTEQDGEERGGERTDTVGQGGGDLVMWTVLRMTKI